MPSLSSRVELAANRLIIVAVLLAVVLVQKYELKGPIHSGPARMQPAIGSKLGLAEFDWAKERQTLVLALQTKCHFCNESAPLSKRLIENVHDKNVKVVAVFSSPKEESAAHLRDPGLTNLEVRQSALRSIQVSGTPTLILINDKGEITNTGLASFHPKGRTMS